MFATRVPLAATAGTPMPGHTESPVHTSPGKGVFGPAKVSRPGAKPRKQNERYRGGGGLGARAEACHKKSFFKAVLPWFVTKQRINQVYYRPLAFIINKKLQTILHHATINNAYIYTKYIRQGKSTKIWYTGIDVRTAGKYFTVLSLCAKKSSVRLVYTKRGAPREVQWADVHREKENSNAVILKLVCEQQPLSAQETQPGPTSLFLTIPGILYSQRYLSILHLVYTYHTRYHIYAYNMYLVIYSILRVLIISWYLVLVLYVACSYPIAG